MNELKHTKTDKYVILATVTVNLENLMYATNVHIFPKFVTSSIDELIGLVILSIRIIQLDRGSGLVWSRLVMVGTSW